MQESLHNNKWQKNLKRNCQHDRAARKEGKGDSFWGPNFRGPIQVYKIMFMLIWVMVSKLNHNFLFKEQKFTFYLLSLKCSLFHNEKSIFWNVFSSTVSINIQRHFIFLVWMVKTEQSVCKTVLAYYCTKAKVYSLILVKLDQVLVHGVSWGTDGFAFVKDTISWS